MKFKLLTLITAGLLSLPFTAHAQQGGGELYVVAEAGIVQNRMNVSGELAGLPTENNSGGSYGIAVGYRTLVSDSFMVGLEGNIATSSASSNVTDGFDTISFDENSVAGIYLTGGVTFGDENEGLLYALLGIGSVSGDTTVSGDFTGHTTIDDKGEGFSFGGAAEFSFTETMGIRVKVLHTRYKGDVDEIKIRDTSVMGGLVYSF